MSIKTLLHGALFGVASVMLVSIGSVHAANGGAMLPGLKATSGTIMCGGFYRLDQTDRSRWAVRNDNEEDVINIDKMRLYNKYGGDPRVEWESDNLPYDVNQVLVAPDNVLEAHQTARYRAEDFPPITDNSRGPGNVQVVFDWSAERAVIPPTITLIRMIFDPYGNALARSTSPCNRIR